MRELKPHAGLTTRQHMEIEVLVNMRRTVMRELCGYTDERVAKKFGVHADSIRRLIGTKEWSREYANKGSRTARGFQCLTAGQIMQIQKIYQRKYELLATRKELNAANIGRRYGVSRATVQRIGQEFDEALLMDRANK